MLFQRLAPVVINDDDDDDDDTNLEEEEEIIYARSAHKGPQTRAF